MPPGRTGSRASLRSGRTQPTSPWRRRPNGYRTWPRPGRSAGDRLDSWNTHVSLAAHWSPDAAATPADLKETVLPEPLPDTYGVTRRRGRRAARLHKLADGAAGDAVLAFLAKTADVHALQSRCSRDLAPAVPGRAHPRLALSRDPVDRMDTSTPTSDRGHEGLRVPAGPELSRRSFLKAAGVAGLVAGIASEGMFAAWRCGHAVRRRRLVVSRSGGFDSLQAIVPTGDPDYRDLAPEHRDPPGPTPATRRDLRCTPRSPRSSRSSTRAPSA